MQSNRDNVSLYVLNNIIEISDREKKKLLACESAEEANDIMSSFLFLHGMVNFMFVFKPFTVSNDLGLFCRATVTIFRAKVQNDQLLLQEQQNLLQQHLLQQHLRSTQLIPQPEPIASPKPVAKQTICAPTQAGSFFYWTIFHEENKKRERLAQSTVSSERLELFVPQFK